MTPPLFHRQFFASRNHEDGFLLVFPAKTEGFLALGFREEASTVEIKQARGSVEPTAYIAPMLQRMGDYLWKLALRIASLRGCVCHSDTFGRLGEGTHMERETIGMRLTILPHMLGHCCHIVLGQPGGSAGAEQRGATQQQHKEPQRSRACVAAGDGVN